MTPQPLKLETVQDYDKTIAKLESDRETLREGIKGAPQTGRIVQLRRQIVEGKLAKADVSKLEAERTALLTERNGKVDELTGVLRELHLGRERARVGDYVRSLENLSDDQLEAEHLATTAERRAMKPRQRALAQIRSRRAAVSRARELLRDLPADQLAALKAELAGGTTPK